MGNQYANVIVEIAVKQLEKPFTYEVPPMLASDINIGSIVLIPFGKGNKPIKGYVIELMDTISKRAYELKSIISIAEGISVESELIQLAYFMSKRYVTSLQLALKSMVPTNQSIKNKTKTNISCIIDHKEIEKQISEITSQRFETRKKALIYLLDSPDTTYEANSHHSGITMPAIQTMVKKGYISLETVQVYREPYLVESSSDHLEPPLEPTPTQLECINQIKASVHGSLSDIYLLHGKTGTGKTEVYMQVIEAVLKEGKQCIVLIPEIGLTPQTVKRFISRFGHQVGVMHSKLSQGERYDQWTKARDGEISIMIGPRSAIFAPFVNLGIIIIDESHESTYKSDTNPKYHAREIAIKRSSVHKCPVVLGSATPLVENYYKALKGQYKLLKLNDRFGLSNTMDIEIIDMRLELENGNKEILSHALKAAIEDRLKKKEQIFLFLNRRGHSNFISCRKCGHVLKCESCDIPYTYHSTVERLICHYCGKSIPKVVECPVCQSKHIKTFGIGTQQVERVLMSMFPGVKVARMDFDTTSKKDGHRMILEGFEEGVQDILVGTQMVAKGHHFENVTLVGVLAADMSLYMNDFRASEKTFQLLNQVSGRMGRGSKGGLSIIQTYTPEHMSVIHAKNDDYESFYHEEIQLRNLLNYPPFTVIMTMMIQGEDEKKVIKRAYQCYELLESLSAGLNVQMIGPSPATIAKVKNRYRWHIFFKGNQYKEIQQLAFHINDIKLKYLSDKLINIGMDINPNFM
ncbi:MAG: primosomal protein N' [Vallitaleaceae bacterium]|jgi:primosomal protein N' (replication factor Y)|nr:primosomal protein N' [Vallitaleaceae bacterium]